MSTTFGTDTSEVASVNCLPEVLGRSSSVVSSAFVRLALARRISANVSKQFHKTLGTNFSQTYNNSLLTVHLFKPLGLLAQ